MTDEGGQRGQDRTMIQSAVSSQALGLQIRLTLLRCDARLHWTTMQYKIHTAKKLSLMKSARRSVGSLFGEPGLRLRQGTLKP